MNSSNVFKSAFAGLLVVVALLGYVGMAQAAGPWYVSATVGNDSNDCLSAITACKTIQAAIDKASPGDTIQVAAGIYGEHVSINKALTVNGANSGIACLAPRGAESVITGDATGAVQILESDVTFNGFQVSAAANALGSGIWMDASKMNDTITNNLISQSQIGLYANSAGASLINCNIFDGNNEAGSAGGAGIYSEFTNELTIDNNEFKNHLLNNPVIFAATGASVHTDLVFSNNVMHDNVFSNVLAIGVSGGSFKDNTITPASDATGITFDGADADIEVTGNVITGGARGVRVRDAGYALGGNSSITINRNDVSANSDYGVGNEGGYTGDLNAECNWWGDATGPGSVGSGSGSGVTTSVDFSTWLGTSDLANDPCSCSSNDAQVVVSDAGTEVGGNPSVPVTPHSAWISTVSIPGATWIWDAEKIPADDTGSNPAGTLTFTRDFVITGTPTEATLEITTDNSYVVTVNGNPVGSDGTWQTVETYTIPAGDLVTGTNVLTIVATNDGPDGPGNPAGLLYKLSVGSSACEPPVVEPEFVHVTIAKYIDGVHASVGNAAPTVFPMQAVYDFTNPQFPSGIAGSDPYPLDQDGDNTPTAYEARTLDFEPGADYSTFEHTNTPVVGAACEGDAYAYSLVGYSWGETEAEAQSMTPTLTPPSFTDMASDKFVIVHNHKCGEVEGASTIKVHIFKYLDGIQATSASSSGYQFPMTATWMTANLNGGASTSGDYVLGNNHGGNAEQYGADTSPMEVPADYTTSEITSGDSQVLPIGASCEVGKYRLVGYSEGDTLSAAQSATVTNDAPVYTDLNADKYVIVWNEKCVEAPACDAQASQTIVSDTSTMNTTDTQAAVLLSTLHGSWVPNLSEVTAKWVWSDDPVVDATVDTTKVFTRTFTIVGTPTGGSLDIAADNGYLLKVNGTTVDDKLAVENNFGASTNYDISSYLISGVNSVEITVKNIGIAESNVAENPAGLIFQIHLTNNECVDPEPVETGELRVIKIVSGGTATSSDFQIHVTKLDTEVAGSPQAGTSTPGTSYTLATGTYVVSETGGPSGYTGVWTGSCDQNGNVDVLSDATVTCTITNTFTGEVTPPTLTIVKKTFGGDGSFTFTLTGNTSTSTGITTSGGVATSSTIVLNLGTSTVSELAESGWTLSDTSCEYDNESTGISVSGGEEISVDSGDHVTCTFTNTSNEPEMGTLSVVKILTNDNNGTATTSDFSFLVNGAATTTFEADGQNDLSLPIGQYTITEVASSTYTATYSGCDNVSVGAATSTCTITNDDIAPSNTNPQCSDGLDNDTDGLVDYPADPGCNDGTDDSETSAAPETQNFGGGGGGGGGGGSGGSLFPTSPVFGTPGQVLGATTQGEVLGASCGLYINDYLHISHVNSPDEVMKLQAFLNENLGTSLPVNGVFGAATFAAVKAFQLKYNNDILKPWVMQGLLTDNTPTGYVYKTTKRWINLIKCPSLSLPLPTLP